MQEVVAERIGHLQQLAELQVVEEEMERVEVKDEVSKEEEEEWWQQETQAREGIGIDAEEVKKDLHQEIEAAQAIARSIEKEERLPEEDLFASWKGYPNQTKPLKAELTERRTTEEFLKTQAKEAAKKAGEECVEEHVPRTPFFGGWPKRWSRRQPKRGGSRLQKGGTRLGI